MTQVYALKSVFTSSLPKLCNKAGCYSDRVHGSTRCSEHELKDRSNIESKRTWRATPAARLKYMTSPYLPKMTLYFMFSQKNKAIKIGITRNLKKRLYTINQANSSPISVSASFESVPVWVEEKLFDYLKEHRIKNDWYRLEGKTCEIVGIAMNGTISDIIDILSDSGV